MADQGRSDFYVGFTMNLYAFELKQVSKVCCFKQYGLKLGMQALGSYFKLIYEYELDILPNTKVDTAKDHVKD